MAVGAQGGGGSGVTEPVLGLEQVSLRDQDGGHGVPEPVQSHVVVAGVVAELGEPVGQA